MSNLDKYKQIFMDVFDVDIEDLNEYFTFKDVPQWDSVAHLSLISELEDTYNVMLDPEDILHYGSYCNGIDILRRYGVEI